MTSSPNVYEPESLREIRALGLRFHPLTKTELLDELFRPRPREAGPLILAGANLHGLYVNHIDPEYDRLLQEPRTIVIVDGMPIVFMLRALGHRVERSHRITWVDWFEDALARAAREGKSVFILGHTQEMLDQGLAKARRTWPQLRIAGRNGFFGIERDSPAAAAVVDEINTFAPDILIVGMGMPRQEAFVYRFGVRIDARVIGLGGAAFAYYAGFERTPPRWMGRWGLEWLYRLLADPKRLAFRYLIEPFALAFFLGRRMLRER